MSWLEPEGYLDEEGGFVAVGDFELCLVRDSEEGSLYAHWRDGEGRFLVVQRVGEA